LGEKLPEESVKKLVFVQKVRRVKNKKCKIYKKYSIKCARRRESRGK
jgi:hypothetical protein